jgi:hypothetical protein
MSKPFANPATTPALQAANVLRAWVTCNEAAFRYELAKTLEFCSVQPTACEEEQVEVLKAVAGSLRNAPLGSVCSTMVHLCVDLLVHLSGQSCPEARVSASPCDTRD